MSIPAISRKSASRLSLALFAALASGVAFAPQAGAADASNPFAEFFGSWKGAGQVVGVNGTKESIRCRADYAPSGRDPALSQSLTCASDSYRFNVRSYAIAEADGVQGHWEESTRQVQGHLVGKVAGGHFSGSISGTGFTAEMSLTASGSKQTVSIKPNGGDIALVDIVLDRAPAARGV